PPRPHGRPPRAPRLRPGRGGHRRRIRSEGRMAGDVLEGARAGPGPAHGGGGAPRMILVIDNYDSFTYNLVQYLGELGAELRVVRNDAVDADGVAALAPERVVISPGPGTPDDAGVSLSLIRRLGERTPILGVCLGHQAIGQAFGGTV